MRGDPEFPDLAARQQPPATRNGIVKSVGEPGARAEPESPFYRIELSGEPRDSEKDVDLRVGGQVPKKMLTCGLMIHSNYRDYPNGHQFFFSSNYKTAICCS